MKKQMFIASIKALQLQTDLDTKNAELMAIVFPGSKEAATRYQNHFLYNQLVAILQEEMNDANAESLIEYFMNDCDFGRKTPVGDIAIETAEELYNLLIENK